jgi:ABC-type antimicrobial peptide transport system permease subunit
MKIPFKYILRNFVARRLTTSITIVGIALVVFVFAAVLMMAYGINKTLAATGSDSNVIVTRKPSQNEISSIIDREAANVILSLPGIAKNSEGKPLASGEPVVVINQAKKGGGMSNVTVRGVSPEVFALRDQVKLREGKMFTFGARELIVGASIVSKFDGANIGNQIKFAGDMWTIVGIYEANGNGFESEMWGDANQLLSAFNRSAYSTITFRLASSGSLEAIQTAFAKEPRLQQYEPKIETKFYEEQSEQMSSFIKNLGLVITVIFSMGAIIGAMITMYGAVANRTVEIGTLRALGFQRRSIMIAFLTESLTLSFIGGGIGLVLASSLQFVKISALNFASFSELAFSFALSPMIVLLALSFSLLMGFVGGFLPSIRASQLQIVNALRAS